MSSSGQGVPQQRPVRASTSSFAPWMPTTAQGIPLLAPVSPGPAEVPLEDWVPDGWSTSWKVIVSNVLHLVH